MSARITKIVCPACEGTGVVYNVLPCQWCRSAKRLPVADALRYADNLHTIAGGGYIAGDHSLEHMREMEAEAAAIRALVEGHAPPEVTL